MKHYLFIADEEFYDPSFSFNLELHVHHNFASPLGCFYLNQSENQLILLYMHIDFTVETTVFEQIFNLKKIIGTSFILIGIGSNLKNSNLSLTQLFFLF